MSGHKSSRSGVFGRSIDAKLILLAAAPALALSLLILPLLRSEFAGIERQLNALTIETAESDAVARDALAAQGAMKDFTDALSAMQTAHQLALLEAGPSAAVRERRASAAAALGALRAAVTDFTASVAALDPPADAEAAALRVRRTGFLERAMVNTEALLDFYADSNERTLGLIDDGAIDAARSNFRFEEVAFAAAVGDFNDRVSGVLDDAAPDLAATAQALRDQRIDAIIALLAESLALTAAIILGVGALIAIGAALFGRRAISAPLGRIATATERLSKGDTDVAIETGRRDEIGRVAGALAVFRENQIEVARLRDEQAAQEERAAAERRAAMAATASRFESGAGDIVNRLGSAAQDLTRSAESMSAIAEQATGASSAVADAAETANANVQSAAGAAEQLSASFAEIGNHVESSRKVAGDAVAQAEEANTIVRGLQAAADEINAIVSLISDIADQTNLLALNATIEAARAGEAGRGFAVVAAEVKQLASQTTQATDDISSRIGAMQSATKDCVAAIGRVADIIGEVDSASTAIAGAVTEQNAATAEIARSVAIAADGATTVGSRISEVADAVRTTQDTAATILAASRALAKSTGALSSESSAFLESVRAA